MKKIIIKSIISAFVIMLLVFGSTGFGIVAKAADSYVASGTAGEGIEWVIDEGGELTISGEGKIEVEWYSPPWEAYSETITSVVLAEGIVNIPDTAFCYCDNIKTFTIPSTVSEIEGLAFDNCSGVEEFIVSDDNETYKSVDGIVFTKDGKAIVVYPRKSDRYEYTISTDVEELGEYAFEGAINLKVINIHGGIKVIPQGCFESVELEEINLAEGIEVIGRGAFVWAQAKKVVIPDSVKTIVNSAFYSSTLLETVIIGSGVEYIGDSVFGYAYDLRLIHYHGTEEDWADVVIEGDNPLLSADNIHFVEMREGIAPTCKDGSSRGFYCASCDEYLTGDVIEAIGTHTPKEPAQENYVEADCDTEASYDLVVRCEDCDTVISKETVITSSALGHEWENGYCATCGEQCKHIDENIDTDCERCNMAGAFEYLTIELDAIGTVTVGDSDVSDEYVIFIPEVSGIYSVYSNNFGDDENIDPRVRLIDEVGEVDITSDDSIGMGYNFKVVFEAVAGRKYLIYLYSYDVGVTYEYSVVKEYHVTEHPTSKNPEVEIGWSENVSYQWYKYDIEEEITDANATPSERFGAGSQYVAGKGWTGDFWNDSGAEFFIVDLLEGEAIYLDFSRPVYDMLGLWDIYLDDGFEVDYNQNGEFILVAPFDGSFSVYSHGVDVDTSLKAYKLSEGTKLEGENSPRLGSPKLGNLYACEMLVPNGEVVMSNPLLYDYAITHQPAATEPYVEINEGEATYQWYSATLGEEITPNNASSVDWGNGESTYTGEAGWSGVSDKFDTSECYDFFTIDLEEGDVITVVIVGDLDGSVGIFDYDQVAGEGAIIIEGCFVYELKADIAGTYTVYAYGEAEGLSIKAYLGVFEYNLEEGATGASYYPESDGYFRCEVTFENGAKEKSNTVALKAHEHKDSDENYVCDECSEELPGKPDVNDDLDGDEGGLPENPEVDDDLGGDEGGLPENPDVNDDLGGDEGGLPVATIIAIIISSVAVVAVIAVAVIVIVKRKR